MEAQSHDFKYWYAPSIERNHPYEFRAEVSRACKLLDQKRLGKSIALCYSGGVDSEIIALTLHELNIPFEMYFLDIWGLNRPAFDAHASDFLKMISKKIQIIRASRAYFYETHCPKVFSQFGVEFPTYLALTYLFDQIPESEFIVVGEGKLERRGALFEKIFKANQIVNGRGELILPFSTSSSFFYSWAEKNQREGEFYFFSSTPQLIASVIQSPLLRVTSEFSDTKEIVHSSFPEIRRRRRSTNWENGAISENKNIRASLRVLGEEAPFWKSENHALVNVQNIFL